MSPAMLERGYRRPVLARMNEVLSHYEWTERQWARVAGLKEESHVGQLRRKLERSTRAYVGNLETWMRLAEAADVSLDWLALGMSGPPWREPTPRERTLSACHSLRFFSAKSLLMIDRIDLPVEPDSIWWLQELMQTERLIALADCGV